MATETTERSFDELTRGLATGSISRGKALRLMGVALVGSTLASFPGVAWAAKGGRSSCAKFCQSLFGANTPEEAECVSAARTGQGPCFTCTTETGCGPNFTKPPCSAGPYSCDRCTCCTSIAGSCGSNGECGSGRCVSGTCAEACPTGTVTLSNGTCAKTCEFETAGEDCADCAFGCWEDVSGSRYCISGQGSGTACASDSNCPGGEICINVPAPIGSSPRICAAAC